MWTLSQWGWPLCGLFLVLVSMEISLCSSRLSDEDGEALMKRAEHFNDSNYTRLMRVAVMGAKNYEPVLFGLTDETLFQCVPMGVGSPTICMISELADTADEACRSTLWCTIGTTNVLSSIARPTNAKILPWIRPWLPFNGHIKWTGWNNLDLSMFNNLFNDYGGWIDDHFYEDDSTKNTYSAGTARHYLFGTGALQYLSTWTYRPSILKLSGMEMRKDGSYGFYETFDFTILGHFLLFDDTSGTTPKKFEGLTARLYGNGLSSQRILLGIRLLSGISLDLIQGGPE
eukprot:GHVS01101264.1.p1 GENE.GHVS01101264.1~~GHVS01101264.1.p1  ORF type:complete len:287 (+),score=0.18 GHVS01101264.1:188-1048(+)